MENQEPKEDRSQDDPHPGVGHSVCQSRHSFYSHTSEAPRMVTGVQGEIPSRPHIVTGIQEDITYCSLGTSSGKQKKARSTSHLPFGSENTPATIDADQILFALQQLASNSISANININRTSKLPESIMTTMPTFHGKSEKFELFGDLFQTSLKIHNQLTEEDKINDFHSKENLAEILTVFRRK